MTLPVYQTPGLDLFNQMEASLDPKPVDIVTFAESKQYCGAVLYPRQKLLLKLMFLEDLTDAEEAILDEWIAGGRNGQEIQISPYVRERIAALKARKYKHFREVVLVGGRRCSKGFITAIALTKLVFDLLQLQDPNQAYGIHQDKEIIFACVAASQDQAKQMQYADFSGMVNSCVPMQRNIFKMQELEFSLMTEADIRAVEGWRRQNRRIQKDTSKIRGRALPANSRTLRGMAAMAIVFDEFAFFQQGESDQSDTAVYSAAVPALAQFNKDAFIMCNSSPYSKVGLFYERFETAMAVEHGGPAFEDILGIRLPSWALFEGWWEDPSYRGPRKSITVSPDWNPERRNEDGSYFYTEPDRQAIVIARSEERDSPEKYKVERRGHFAETIDAYLRPEMVDRMFAGRPTKYDPETGQWAYQPMATNWDESTYMNKYYAHLDPSSTTAGFGFALGHTEEFEFNNKIETHVVFDIIKRWDPADFENHTIDWEPILEWVARMCQLFHPVQVTMDQFNSTFPISWLRKRFRETNVETRVFEITANAEKNWNRAEIFRTALNRGLVHAPFDTPDCEYGAQELKFLQEISAGRIPRVEKQSTGPVQTKDVADAIMTVTEVTIGNLMAASVRQDLAGQSIIGGASGGYPIGGSSPMGAQGTALAPFYAKRSGEQRFMKGMRDMGSKPDPARRAAGGRPIPRKLPGW